MALLSAHSLAALPQGSLSSGPGLEAPEAEWGLREQAGRPPSLSLSGH